MAKRTAEQAEETRRALVAAGTRLFGDLGYAGASLAAITEAAGTTKGALFHHFDSKEDLFRAVWTELQVDMDSHASKAAIAARSRTDPYAAFLAGCRTYIEWAELGAYQQIVLIDGPAVLGAAGWYERDNALGHQNVVEGLKYLASEGLIDENRITPFAFLLQNALNGAGFALSRKAEGVTAESLFEAFEIMLRQLR